MAHESVPEALPEPEPKSTASRRQSTFYSLRYRDYRYLWQGQVGASASMWMEQIARPLLILELTDSAFMVGLIAATRMLPQLLMGLWAGVLADRIDKKRILVISQAATLATHMITAALVLTGVVEPWMVFVTAFASGASMAFNQPARQSLIPRLVPDEALTNAVALNSAAMNFMRIGGASLAGALLIFIDLGNLYVIQSLIYVWVIFSTSRIRTTTEDASRKRGSMLSDLLEGFSAVRQDRTILYIFFLTMILFVWGVPYQSVFVPLLAVDELGVGQSGVGLLIAMVGIGALAGSLGVATVGDSLRRRGLAMLVMLATYSLALVLLSRSDSLLLAVPALMISGATQTSFMSLNNAYVLGRTSREMQGRVMSLFSLDRGLVPLGAAIGGFMAETLGTQTALSIMALICLSCTLLIALLAPAIRKIA